ncbi:DUF2852 domain-containing protein [Rhodobacter capsulatus]|uniref:DUF2852 domain-containing protein n=1 Tax=Rhodobacter capsulatus TaxID=1061 RepID=A0A0Q0UKX7_RHOCA|nr:DUF2852 domain-containing protein [Rhodobacter capsulatus]KQB14105.1 hypothetical protein AP073_16080 [Rhodobacter capsulatus]KQB15773.1 hypothetical protein AP071_13915 [Rhodobacter capsulatus]PZX26423.1 uncharacterized protein DUF2852 [Rhodobacter capsulatus]QNR61911.1 DUF2852 domain-containing protein [Rhodobacter capsulatus]WER10695.1 DUF2852 domain-containing protein [Rhodobacter capsulatus]
MTYTTAATHTGPERPGTITRTLAWLDDRGPMSWIVVMIGSFIFAGPLGLLVLGFILMTGRFSGRTCRARAGFTPRFARGYAFHAMRPTGNAAFDAYRADMLARLEREQEEFESFLIRLREARDKAEFDQYMEERAHAAAAAPVPADRPADRQEAAN